MGSPLVSVVLAVYNGDAYLSQAIRSVLDQRLDEELELIVINDGSTDASLEIARQFERTDPRVRVITRNNRGFVNSLNEGISAARGEWIARMDADDICAPDRLHRQILWAKQQNADICGGWIRTFGATIPRVRRYPVSDSAIKLQLLFNSCFAHPTVIARREVMLEFPYDRDSEPVDDYELWTRLASAGIRLTNCPNVVLRYRVHQKQMSTTKRKDFDIKRAEVSERYRNLLFPDLPKNAHARTMSRQVLLENQQVLEGVTLFKSLYSKLDDVERVISGNAFLYLARHAQIGTTTMLQAARSTRLTATQCLVLYFLAIARADQHSILYKTLYALK
jgi:glycosyltransferase involved in cell wall biosynthesis